MDLDQVKYDEKGLAAVIVQDYRNGQVLMFAYANREALEKTIETGKAHFWSRSRERLWMKGEESGNVQEVKGIYFDCDRDAVLMLVDQKGVACHTGQRTCFFTPYGGGEQTSPAFGSGTGAEEKTLRDVWNVVDDRRRNPREGSYVSGLFEKGLDKILKKISEEAGEVVIAAKNESRKEVVYETADLWFHSLIALSYFGITPEDIFEELGRRFGKPSEAYRNSDG